MPPLRPVLVIADGDLPGLLAVAAAASDTAQGSAKGTPEPLVWHPIETGEVGQARAAAARRQAEAYGLELVESAAPAATGHAPRIVGMLVEAASLARSRGLEAAVWPIHAAALPEPDLDAVSRAIDQSLLVSRLVSLDASARPVEVRTPYVDFTDREIADLVLDMDLPVWTCWWHAGESPDARGERDRWLETLRDVGWVDRRAPAGAAADPGPANTLKRSGR